MKTILDFGAVGDAKLVDGKWVGTDNTKAIQAAFDSFDSMLAQNKEGL